MFFFFFRILSSFHQQFVSVYLFGRRKKQWVQGPLFKGMQFLMGNPMGCKNYYFVFFETYKNLVLEFELDMNQGTLVIRDKQNRVEHCKETGITGYIYPTMITGYLYKNQNL